MGGISYLVLMAAAIAGTVAGIQSAFNSTLGRIVGLAEMVFMVNLTGLIASGILLIFGLGKGSFHSLTDAPWYTWLGGVLGVIVVGGISYAIPKVGVALGLGIFIMMQMAISVVIDHFGLFGITRDPLTWSKIIGVGFLLIGIKILLK